MSISSNKMMRTPPNRLSEAFSQPELSRATDPELNITVRKRKHPEDSCDNMRSLMSEMFSGVQQMFADLKTCQDKQFTQIREDINALKNQNEHLLQTYTELNTSMNLILEEQNQLKVRVEKLELTKSKSDEHANILEQRMEGYERKLKENTIEIKNLPTENNSQVDLAIKQIYKTLQVEYDTRDIHNVYRLPSKNNRPRPIIIEYSNPKIKSELIQAYKRYSINNKGQKLDSSILEWTDEKSIIYINECLTKKGNHLLYLARDLVKKSDWKFYWSTRGKVFIKKEEGSPPIEITSQEQITHLANTAPKC